MFKISELRHKDVINESDGKKLGYAYDIELDADKGELTAIVLPGESRFLGLFIRSEDIVIPWERIQQIGVDIILLGNGKKTMALPENTLTEPPSLLPKDTPKAAAEKNGSFDWDNWEI